MKDSLTHYGLFEMIGEQYFFPTVGQAVNRYLESHAVERHDWEDQAQACRANEAAWYL